MSNQLLPDWARQFDSLPTSIGILKTDKNNSDKSVSDTVAMMAKHSNSACNSPQVNQAVNDSGARGLEFDREKLASVFAYIKMRIKFVEDDSQLANLFQVPSSKELLITPPVLLSMISPKGDCDDFSMLCCSMLMNLGIQCNFVTIAADRTCPEQYTHVYCMAVTGEGLNVPMDCSHGKYIGWEASPVFRKQIWPVFNTSVMKGSNDMRKAIGWLGDDSIDPYSNIAADTTGTYTMPLDIYGPGSGLPPSSITLPGVSSGVNWNALLPNLFGSVEKIALQTTQQPGIQTTGPNGQTMSQVLAPGQTQSILSTPNLFGSTTGSSTTLMLVAAVAFGLFLFSRK